jgi:phage terminase large subunit-like protein
MASNPYIKRANTEDDYDIFKYQELEKCSNDPIYFIKNYVKIQHPTRGTIPFEIFDYQIEMIDTIHNNKDSLLLASRQLGKTTVAAIYILWLASFSKDKNCVIASKAMAHATEIMSRIKFSYEELPNWLKPGCKFYNRSKY